MAKDRNPIITAEKMMQLALLLADEQQFDMQGYEMTDCYDSYLLEDLDGENGISGILNFWCKSAAFGWRVFL